MNFRCNIVIIRGIGVLVYQALLHHPVNPDRILQIDRGREPLQRSGIAPRDTGQKALSQHGKQGVQNDLQEVQHQVDGRHGKEISGEKGRKGGRCKVKEALSQHHQYRHQQSLEGKCPRDQGNQHAQPAGHTVGNEHHGHAGQETGGQKAFPPDGHGVHHAHAAGAV